MVTKKSLENCKNIFTCECCDYICCKNSEYIKHLLTRKHIGNASGNKKISTNTYNCKICNKSYKSRKGLWGHNKLCNNIIEIENFEKKVINNSDMEVKSLSTLVVDLIKSNHELQKQMLDICKNSNNTINSNNNSHNKTFNLNFFLNEQCKDAMNIMEFVDTFQLQFSDLERIGEVGYVEGISSIIINKLNEMDIYKRPIHCSDAKREIMYVKDNDVWDKDNETNDKIRLAIRYISKKNNELVIPWRELHPGVRNYDHRLNDKYQEIIIQSLGGKNTTTEEGETKIIRKISKMVLIDKRM
jgi:hypothetical protein